MEVKVRAAVGDKDQAVDRARVKDADKVGDKDVAKAAAEDAEETAPLLRSVSVLNAATCCHMNGVSPVPNIPVLNAALA